MDLISTDCDTPHLSVPESIRTHRLFAVLSESQLESALQRARTVELKKGKLLFKQGDAANYFYFVLEGQIKLFRMIKDGAEKLIQVVPSGRPFAHAIMFRQEGIYPLCAEAMCDSRIYRIHSKDYLGLIKRNNDLALELLADMSVYLSMMINDIETLSLKSSRMRVVHYFLEHLEDSSDTITLPTSKYMVASQLAMQPETLSRILHKLQQDRIIEVDGLNIKILTRSGLEALES